MTTAQAFDSDCPTHGRFLVDRLIHNRFLDFLHEVWRLSALTEFLCFFVGKLFLVRFFRTSELCSEVGKNFRKAQPCSFLLNPKRLQVTSGGGAQVPR